MATSTPTVAFIPPMLASRGALPAGPEWGYEVKWDGIRGQAAIHNGRVIVRSRPGRDCTASFPELSQPPPSLTARHAVLDGEIVSLDQDGHPDFAAVRARLVGGRSRKAGRAAWLACIAFDLLALDGEPLTNRPCSDRRELLAGLGLEGPTWRTPASFDDAGPLLAATRAHGLEGVIAKRLDSRYRPGQRSPVWVKHKHLRTERLTVIGHARTQRHGARLLVASTTDGELRYRGLVELGLAREDLWQALAALEQPRCPLPWKRPPHRVTWVTPELDVEVHCHGRNGALREATVRALSTSR